MELVFLVNFQFAVSKELKSVCAVPECHWNCLSCRMIIPDARGQYEIVLPVGTDSSVEHPLSRQRNERAKPMQLSLCSSKHLPACLIVYCEFIIKLHSRDQYFVCAASGSGDNGV